MYCNGLCNICGSPCVKGEIKTVKDSSKQPVNVEILQNKGIETGISVVEPVKYEVVTNIFGKEKVRRVK